jgi:c-di-GMP-binding flagellar brake protein YcgR
MRKEIPLTIEKLHDSDEEKYLISSPREIRLTLQAVVQKKPAAVLYFDNDQHFIKTIPLAVTDSGIWLDIGPSEEDNRILLGSEHVTLVTMHQGAKVQFLCPQATMAVYASKPAFHFPLPQQIYRFQRRDFFRLALPGDDPLNCIIPTAQPAASQVCEVVIMDISVGGIALKCKEDSINLVEGEIYPDCKIELPGIGTLKAAIQIKNLFEVSSPSGHITKHAGCEFINLDGKMSMLLQRYVSVMQNRLSRLA